MRGAIRDTLSMEPKARALRVLKILVAVDLLLVLIYALTWHGDYSHTLAKVFHLDQEWNIPSTWSALQLILAGAAVLACIPVESGSQLVRGLLPARYVWVAVGTLLMLMGVDEYLTWHENLKSIIFELGIMQPGETTIDGYAWPWTVYGVVFVIFVGIPLAVLTRRVLAGHPSLFRILLLAGAVFCLGALGLENLRVYSINYQEEAAANMLVILEETSEMIAVSLVVFVFMRYRAERQQELAPEAAEGRSTLRKLSESKATG